MIVTYNRHHVNVGCDICSNAAYEKHERRRVRDIADLVDAAKISPS